jgi:hypothetical protein
MPLGINRTDENKSPNTSYRKGTPINTATHNFGNPVDLSTKSFGNPEPSSGTEKNNVNWSPDPTHFGNTIVP